VRLTTAFLPAVAVIGLHAAPARAATRSSHAYVIAIGYNGLPTASSVPLGPLRFADDDAIAFATYAAEGARQTHVLTVADAETERRLGRSMPPVVAPTAAELRAAVDDVHRALDRDTSEGVESTVYLYYSGHGSDEAGRPPALALLDAELTRDMLYDGVLAKLPATHVHLFVDACHAEAVVRPRDSQALVVPTSEEDAASYARTSTLARFPNVGAIVATTSGAQTHEWDAYGGGIFTHELLSGLRGGADVDADGRIEYSEIAAFLSAANGAVTEPRAHLEPVVHPPVSDPRTAIVDVGARTGEAVLEGPLDGLGLVTIEDDRGDRLLDIRAESGHRARLSIPAATALYIRSERGEAALRLEPGTRTNVASLVFSRAPVVARGAVESALHRGLFATPFGRSYYRGFVDAATDLIPVPLIDQATVERMAGHDALGASVPVSAPVPNGAVLHEGNRTFAWIALGTAGATAIASGVFGALALDAQSTFRSTSLERPAAAAAARYNEDSAAFLVLAGCTVLASAIGTYLWVHPVRRTGGAAALAPGFDTTRLTFRF